MPAPTPPWRPAHSRCVRSDRPGARALPHGAGSRARRHRSSSTAIALDARTGERRWSVSLAEITASAAIDGAANTYLASGCSLSDD